MIKVVFTYKTKKENLNELMEKFQLSASEEFNSSPSNVGIEMSKREDGNDVYVVLDIYYNSRQEYEQRDAFEKSQKKWNEIWFNECNSHTEVSVLVFDVLKEK